MEGLLRFKKLDPNAVIPAYQTPGSAGFDLVAIETVLVPVGEVRLVRTGLACEIPEGWQMEVRPRSGLAAGLGSYIANAPGTIDSDYRGEIKIIVQALHSAVGIQAMDRVAQGVMMPAPQFAIKEVGELSDTKRGCGGFGSTG